MAFGVDSEVGRLRQVVVHRPGPELSRLTPQNLAAMGFDDVVWAKRAAEEHDAFAETLRAQGVAVHVMGELLTHVLDLPAGRAFVLERCCTPEAVGPALCGPLRRHLEDLDSAALAKHLVGGVTKADLKVPGARGLTWDVLGPDDVVLAPLPHHLYARDGATWIGGGVALHPLGAPARRREALHRRAVLRFHPLFSDQVFRTYTGDDDCDHLPAALEGGDVAVLGERAVLVGVGAHTTPMGAELLARALFRAGAVDTVVVVALPEACAGARLDALVTMVDRATFALHPAAAGPLRSWTLRPGDAGADEVCTVANVDLWAALAECFAPGELAVRTTGADARTAAHERGEDVVNYLAVAPGVVVGYDRNVVTNRMLRTHGLEVVPVAGTELGRGRGGPRRLAWPIERDPA